MTEDIIDACVRADEALKTLKDCLLTIMNENIRLQKVVTRQELILKAHDEARAEAEARVNDIFEGIIERKKVRMEEKVRATPEEVTKPFISWEGFQEEHAAVKSTRSSRGYRKWLEAVKDYYRSADPTGRDWEARLSYRIFDFVSRALVTFEADMKLANERLTKSLDKGLS